AKTRREKKPNLFTLVIGTLSRTAGFVTWGTHPSLTQPKLPGSKIHAIHTCPYPSASFCTGDFLNCNASNAGRVWRFPPKCKKQQQPVNSDINPGHQYQRRSNGRLGHDWRESTEHCAHAPGWGITGNRLYGP